MLNVFRDNLKSLKFVLWFVVIGVALHSWGMFDRHRALVAATGALPWWWRALYAGCWGGLAVLVAYAIVRAV